MVGTVGSYVRTNVRTMHICMYVRYVRMSYSSIWTYVSTYLSAVGIVGMHSMHSKYVCNCTLHLVPCTEDLVPNIQKLPNAKVCLLQELYVFW